MVTLEDVAKKAKVSTMTVSRVINGYQFIKNETRTKVLQAIHELNYSPNIMARGLVTHQSRAIAYVVEHIANPYYAKIMQGMECACFENGYALILCSADSKKTEIEYIQNLKQRCIDGVIFHQSAITEEQLKDILDQDIKVLLIDNKISFDYSLRILNDGYYGAFTATKHLINLGHTKIGVISGDEKNNYDTDLSKNYNIWNYRMNGFFEAMKEHALDVPEDYIARISDEIRDDENPGDIPYRDISGGKMAMQKLMKLKNPPTAIVAQCDLHAIGAINAAIEAGFSVPGDFSIIGHDGIELGEVLYPKLTTVAQPRFEMGYSAAKMIFSALKGSNPRAPMKIKPELIIRDSTISINN